MTLTREHERAIEVAAQTFARQWGTMLSSRLGALAAVTLETIELHTYDEYIQSLPQTTTMVVLQVEPSRTPALLQIPTDAAMTIIDCLLGGPAVPLDMPFREMTEIEWSLMKDMLEHAVGELAYGFAAIMPLQFEVRSAKYNPHFMQVVPASEPVLVMGFELTIGENSAPITLMLVADVVMSQLRAAGTGGDAQRRGATRVRGGGRAAVATHVRGSVARLRAVLGPHDGRERHHRTRRRQRRSLCITPPTDPSTSSSAMSLLATQRSVSTAPASPVLSSPPRRKNDHRHHHRPRRRGTALPHCCRQPCR